MPEERPWHSVYDPYDRRAIVVGLVVVGIGVFVLLSPALGLIPCEPPGFRAGVCASVWVAIGLGLCVAVGGGALANWGLYGPDTGKIVGWFGGGGG